MIYYNSNTNYQELASDSTGLKSQSRKTVITSDASHKCGVSSIPTLLYYFLQIKSFHNPFFMFKNLLGQFKELRKMMSIVPPLIHISLSMVSFTHVQPRSKNIKQKIPEINNLYVLNSTPF